MRIPVESDQTNKKFSASVQPKKACKLKFADHSWLIFLDRPHSDIVVFAKITFQICNIIVTKWKHGIDPNYIFIFNIEL